MIEWMWKRLALILCRYLSQDYVQPNIMMTPSIPLQYLKTPTFDSGWDWTQSTLHVCATSWEAFGTGSLAAWDSVLGTWSFLFHPGPETLGDWRGSPLDGFPSPLVAVALLTDPSNCAMLVSAAAGGGIKTIAIVCNLFHWMWKGKYISFSCHFVCVVLFQD